MDVFHRRRQIDLQEHARNLPSSRSVLIKILTSCNNIHRIICVVFISISVISAILNSVTQLNREKIYKFLPITSSGNSWLARKLQIFLQPTCWRFFRWGWNIGTAMCLPDKTDSNFATVPLSRRSITSSTDTPTVSKWTLVHFVSVRRLITRM